MSLGLNGAVYDRLDAAKACALYFERTFLYELQPHKRRHRFAPPVIPIVQGIPRINLPTATGIVVTPGHNPLEVIRVRLILET